MYFDKKQKEILRKAAAIPLRLIWENIPKRHLKLYLPYVIIPTGKSDPPHICYLLSPEELNLERSRIWPDVIYNTNKEFIDKAVKEGRKYRLEGKSEPAAIYREIEKFNDHPKRIPINIHIYKKNYGQIRSTDNPLEYQGLDNLYPMIIYCRQKNGECFLLASADYDRSPYLDFKAIRWKDTLKSITEVQFWSFFKPSIIDIDFSNWREFKQSALSVIKQNSELKGFHPHHMKGGVENNIPGYDIKVIEVLSTDKYCKAFISSYDYETKVEGRVENWQWPPLRALLNTCENDPKKSIDLTETITKFKESFPGEKLLIFDNIPPKYNYFWFNCSSLLFGIKAFIDNNTNLDVKFILSFNIIDEKVLKGLMIQIYQIDNTSSLSINSKYTYNENFPYPMDGRPVLGGLKNAIKYFYLSGVKIILYKAFHPELSRDLASLIILKNEDKPEVIASNLEGGILFDATLGLFIPAEADSNYCYRKCKEPMWLVVSETNGETINYFKEKFISDYKPDNSYSG